MKLLNYQNLLIASFLFALTFGIATTVIAQNNQVDPMLEVEKDNCQGTTEVNYRSQKLTSLDGETTVYYEGVLRRVGKKGDQSGHDGYCYPLKGRQTPITTLLVEKSALQRISFPATKRSYFVSNPASFSPNNRYLIVEYAVGYDGGDGEFRYAVIDTQEKYKILDISPCYDSSAFEYKGFISPLEILLDCGNGSFEVANLEKKSVRKVSESFAKSAKTTKLYGTISGEMTILKRQVFPPRK